LGNSHVDKLLVCAVDEEEPLNGIWVSQIEAGQVRSIRREARFIFRRESNVEWQGHCQAMFLKQHDREESWQPLREDRRGKEQHELTE